MSQQLDIDKLSTALKSKREALKLGLRAAADQIGISFPTLSRIEKGNVPDLETYLKLCDWMKVNSEEYIKGGSGDELNQEKIIAHFRADRQLDSETVDLVSKMIRFAYNQRKVKQ